MDNYNKFLDEHEIVDTINVPTDDASEHAGLGKEITVFKRKDKVVEADIQKNPFYIIIKDNNKTIIYDNNE